jgi:hypothetical protein
MFVKSTERQLFNIEAYMVLTDDDDMNLILMIYCVVDV